MGTSIFPEAHAGGLEVRDAAGGPAHPPGVEQAYAPLPPFISTCPVTALPSDCTARIEPRQINAIVSELLSFAECLDPNGPWDCNSLQNLCTAFQAWALVNISGVIVNDTPPPPQTQPILWWESDTGLLFIWYDDGTSAQWVQVAGSSSSETIISDTPPPPQTKPILWWESDTGILFIWYDDGTSGQWVQISGGGGSGGGSGSVTMDMVSIVGSGTPVDPHSVGLVDCGTY